MQSCDEILDLISAALDDQLAADEQTVLHQHLADCPACSALFDELRGLHEATAQLEEIAAPAGFTQQVMNCIAADPAQEQVGQVIPFPTKKVSRNPWKKWAACAAAVAIVAFGAVSLPGQFAATKSDTAERAQYMTADDYEVAFDAALNSTVAEQEYSVQDSKLSDCADKSKAESSPVNPESTTEAPAALCGTLYLADDHLPDGLDAFQPEKHADGSLYYYVSADYFFSLQEQGFSFSDNTEDLVLGSSDAKHGLIIVKPAS